MPPGNPDADPKAWDWQNEPHNLPVFSPYPFSKVGNIIIIIIDYYYHFSSNVIIGKVVDNQPSFLKINRNVSVMVGETAHLPCRVKNLDRYTVSINNDQMCNVLCVLHELHARLPDNQTALKICKL